MEKSKEIKRSRSGRILSISEVETKIKQQIRSALRKIWSRYSIDREHCLYKARTNTYKTNKDGSIGKRIAVTYKCAQCGILNKLEDIQVDHIDPVGKTPEFVDFEDWGKWLAKLFVSYDRLRVLCKPCHANITKEQRSVQKL